MSQKDGVDIRVNRFLMQGEGNIKYTYNNGLIAKDEKLAAMNFLNALEKLPGYIEQEQKKITEIQKDLPILQEVINGTWSKESRLSELKTEQNPASWDRITPCDRRNTLAHSIHCPTGKGSWVGT